MPRSGSPAARGVWSLVLHGGAGPDPSIDYSQAESHMSGLLKRGAALLADGAHAVDVVAEMVRELEACGLHVAGRGSHPDRNGRFLLDAAIMDGETRSAGAVCALEGFLHPVEAARAVMQHTPHVLLAGEGAAAFARAHGLAAVEDARTYYTPAPAVMERLGEVAHGTVGAVARDVDGSLAAATSTGGLLNKTPGRVGDTPLIGAGTWADERIAVSCTGVGEYFIRTATAADVSARIRYGRQGLAQACERALEDVAFLGGEGGLIAVDVLGRVAMKFNTQGMKRGFVLSTGETEVKTFA